MDSELSLAIQLQLGIGASNGRLMLLGPWGDHHAHDKLRTCAGQVGAARDGGAAGIRVSSAAAGESREVSRWR